MKIRNGFVSNSSSSSFIVGVARIINYEKFLQIITENPSFMDYIQFFEKRDTVYSKNWDISTIGDNFYVESFQTDVKINISALNDTDKIVITNISNNEGDGAFTADDDYELDYDIDLDHFSESQQQIYQLFHNSDIIDVNNMEITFGAGRNG